MTARRLIAIAAVSAAVAGCGATPPQPPLHEAGQLGSATGSIATACGESYQISAFGGRSGRDERELAALDSIATSAANQLARVFKRNPKWIFQGETVAKIASDGAAMLGACDLHRAANVLAAATRGH